MLSLIWIEISKRRGAIIGWGLGLAAYAAMILSIAPELSGQFENFNLQDIAIYQAFGITEAITSSASLLAAYLPFFGLMLGAYAIITGANALAGEEDSGTLEMLIAAPINRWKVVIAKIMGIIVALILLCLITFAGYAAVYSSVQAELTGDLTLSRFFASSLEMFPIAFFFAMFALMLGAYLPRRGHAIAIGVVLLMGSYLLNNLAGVVGSTFLEQLLPYQPFEYYKGGKVLQDGVDYYAASTLVIAGVVCAALGLLAFQRRNVTVGAWPWQRGRVSAEAAG